MSVRHLTEPRLPTRVVILGGSGFVGSHLATYLRGNDIPVISISTADMDLADPAAAGQLTELLEEDDSLIVAAALTPDKGNDIACLMRNLRMAETISSCSPPALAHLIYISSDAVYGPGESLAHESSVPAPSNLYGHMHYLREQMVASLAHRWRCPFLILRPCALYGPGDTHNSYGPNRFLRSAFQEQRITLFGDGEELRDHLFIDDLTRLLGLCLSRRSTGCLNAATGQAVSFSDLATRIAQLHHVPNAIDCRPRTTIVTHRHFDISELIRAFPTFRFTSLAEGLHVTYESHHLAHPTGVS